MISSELIAVHLCGAMSCLNASSFPVAVRDWPGANTRSHKELRLLNTNAQSIENKMEKLKSFLLCHDAHIAVIIKTWLQDDIGNEKIVPSTYNLFRRDRSSRGAGVAVIAKSTVDVVVLEQTEYHENLFLKLNCWGSVIILISL